MEYQKMKPEEKDRNGARESDNQKKTKGEGLKKKKDC